MDADRLAAARAAKDGRYDDVRAQRTWGRIEEAIARPERASRRAPLMIGLALTTAVVLAAVLVWPRGGSSLELLDGSIAWLGDDAAIEVLEQSATRVRVRQRAGEITYDVTRRPERTFEVELPSARVVVLGTRFVVRTDGDRLSVRVERGRVRVEAGARQVVLEAGASVELDVHEAVAESAEAAEPVAVEAVAESAEAAERVAVEATPREAVPPSASTPAEPAGDEGSEAAAPRPPARGTPSSERASESDPPGEPPFIELMRRADDARASGDLDGARDLVRVALATHPPQQLAASAWFTLGRIEVRRGDVRAAVDAFDRCVETERQGPLAEDAAAAAVRALAAVDAEEASSRAQRFVDEHPASIHTAAMRAFVR